MEATPIGRDRLFAWGKEVDMRTVEGASRSVPKRLQPSGIGREKSRLVRAGLQRNPSCGLGDAFTAGGAEDFAGEVAAFLAGKEDVEGGDFYRLTGAAQRNLFA